METNSGVSGAGGWCGSSSEPKINRAVKCGQCVAAREDERDRGFGIGKGRDLYRSDIYWLKGSQKIRNCRYCARAEVKINHIREVRPWQGADRW